MAPKKQMMTTKFLRTERHKPSQVSVADDSSWRNLDQELVDGHIRTIHAGDYGNTSMEQPTLMAEGGVVRVSTHCGGAILRNGKQWMAAMQFIEKEVAGMSETARADCEWLVDTLVDHLANGLPLQVFEFVGAPYDRLQHQTMECFKHEESQNEIAKTTVGDRAATALAFYEKHRKDWALAKQEMLQVMGAAKESTIKRWITLAKELPDGLLPFVKQWRHLPQNFFIGNRHLTGTGEEKRFKLSPTYAKVAFNWLQAAKSDGDEVSSTEFANVFCLAAKHAESWERGTTKRFGVTATSFAAYGRSVEWLQSSLGFQKVRAWMRDADLRKQPNFADANLTAVVQEMEKVHAGSSKATWGGGPSRTGASGRGRSRLPPGRRGMPKRGRRG
jgi:hypothetical protein